MVEWTRPFVLGLLGVLLTCCSSGSRLAPTAQGACDSNCRLRFTFYFCNAPSNACITFNMETCLLCVYGGQCDNSSGYNPPKTYCGTPANGPIYAMYYRSDSGCSASCDCTNMQQVEATGSFRSSENVQAIPVCILP